MTPEDITKFKLDLGTGDNPVIKETITKLTEFGMVRGDSISEIVNALIEDSLVNKHIEVRLGSDFYEKN